MKKLTLIILAVLLCVAFSACAEKEEVIEENTAHTIPATQPVVAEPEWAQVDCDISLVDADTNTVILYAEDFTNFAVMGTTDDDSYIILQTTEDGKNTVNSMTEVPSLQLVINGETKADVTFEVGAFTGEIEFGHALPYQTLCELASTIRGLF